MYEIAYFGVENASHRAKNIHVLPEARHASLRCPKEAKVWPAAPGSAMAGGTVLLHPIGLSTI